MEIKNDGVNIYLHCVTLLRIINELMNKCWLHVLPVILTISAKAGFNEAPPTRNPSTSFYLIKSAALASVTDPP